MLFLNFFSNLKNKYFIKNTTENITENTSSLSTSMSIITNDSIYIGINNNENDFNDEYDENHFYDEYDENHFYDDKTEIEDYKKYIDNINDDISDDLIDYYNDDNDDYHILFNFDIDDS